MITLSRSTGKLRRAAVSILLLAMSGLAVRPAVAQTILQYGFDFNSGTVASNGASVNDDSGVFNNGQILVGNGGTYLADIPTNTQFTTGIGSLDVSNNNSIGTDPTGATNQGTGLLVPGFNFLNFTEIANAGGLTVEVWARNLRPGTGETLGQVVSVGAVYGIMVDSSSRIRAFNGFNIGQSGSAMTSVLTNDWTHLAAVYRNPVVANNTLTVDIELFVNGTSADVVQGSVILQDLNRGAGVGNNAVAAINPEAADGLVFEPRVSLGALTPGNFTIATPSALPVYPSLQINRETGAMTLVGGEADFPFLGYSIRSATAQGLDPSPGKWTSITGNYDAGGNASVDSDAWEVLSDLQAHDELSEQELAGGSGGAVLETGDSINLGTPWIRSPLEDVVVDLIRPDGQLFRLSVDYIGNDGLPFAVGDLNFDGAVNGEDWPIYRAGIREDLTGLSPAEAYQFGDLNGDGENNAQDFVIFRTALLEANPGASFADLTSVPEPSGVLLVVCCMVLFGLRKCLCQPGFLQIAQRALATRGNPRQFIHRSGRLSASVLVLTMASASVAPAAVVSVDFQSDIEGLFATMSGVEANASAADAAFGAANIWNVAGLTSHYSVEGSVDVNPAWGNFRSSTGHRTTARFSITGNVIGTEVIGLGQNALNSDALYFSQPGASNSLSWQISGLTPGSPFKLYLNQLDVSTWLGNPQNRAMSGLIDTNGDGTPNEAYQMNFPGVLVTGTVAADGTIRGTSERTSSTPNIFVTEPNWAGWQLSAEVPDALTLEVNRATGSVKLMNSNTAQGFDIDYYEILSAESSLNNNAWTRLAGQNAEFPAGNGSGNGWEDAGTPRAGFLGEVYLSGDSAVASEASISLGNAYNVSVDAQDLIFNYVVDNLVYEGNVVYVSTTLPGDFDSDGDVDGADFVAWQTNFPKPNSATPAQGDADADGDVDGADFAAWQSSFPNSSPGTNPVPEPMTCVSMSLAVLLVSAGRSCRRRNHVLVA